jgi:transcriptional regulator with XRE-family HTH domain
MLEHPPPAHVTAAAASCEALRAGRRRQDLTLVRLGELAGVSVSTVHGIESGRGASVEMYGRLASALGRRLQLALGDPDADPVDAPTHAQDVPSAREGRLDGRDIVHAAMGEIEASMLRRRRRRLALEEPWQHFRFAGRADLIAWSVEGQALLHVENRTRFPDVQDALGRFNEKRAYLAGALWERLGMTGPPAHQTHVKVALWSAEVMDVLDRGRATFRASFPSPPDAFLRWWDGADPRPGRTTCFVLLDPFASGRERRCIGLQEALSGAQPRIGGYAEAADLVRRGKVQRG